MLKSYNRVYKSRLVIKLKRTHRQNMTKLIVLYCHKMFNSARYVITNGQSQPFQSSCIHIFINEQNRVIWNTKSHTNNKKLQALIKWVFIKLNLMI